MSDKEKEIIDDIIEYVKGQGFEEADVRKFHNDKEYRNRKDLLVYSTPKTHLVDPLGKPYTITELEVRHMNYDGGPYLYAMLWYLLDSYFDIRTIETYETYGKTYLRIRRDGKAVSLAYFYQTKDMQQMYFFIEEIAKYRE